MRAMRISRRDFARTVGVGVGAALLPKRARAEEPTKQAAPPPPSKLPAASQAEADARVQMIAARRGARLSPAERADLGRLSHDLQQGLDKLRAFAVEFTDEPAHIFRAPRRRR